jgi:hypothetical protein
MLLPAASSSAEDHLAEVEAIILLRVSLKYQKSRTLQQCILSL